MDNTVTIETLIEKLNEHDPTQHINLSISPANIRRLTEDYELRDKKTDIVLENLKENIEATSAIYDNLQAQYRALTGVTHRWFR